MRALAGVAASLLTVTICLADDGSGSDIVEKLRESEKRIPLLIERYASTIGCEFQMDKHNVVPYEFAEMKSYIAVFSLDNGCSGGSAMSRPVFVVLQPSAYGKILINAEYSAPHRTSEKFPSLVTKLFVKDNKLWFKAKAYDLAKDALCCPSVPIIGQVEYVNGEWVPIVKQLPNTAVKRDVPQASVARIK